MMKQSVPLSLLSIAMALFMVMVAFGQYAPRQDVIWARSVDGATLTLDGVLDEPAWESAEELHIVYGEKGPLPTSGWRPEFQPEAITDPTDATVKLLVDGNYFWVGFDMPDSSVGGIQDWARWDGILLNIRDRASENRPTPATEYFYTWWYVNIDSLVEPGAPPRFIGRFGNFDDTTRTAEQRAAWDARTVIHGGMSNDAGKDEGWTVEMRFDVSQLGYDPTRPEGDVIEFNFSIWDGDYIFEGNPDRVNSTRTWWQNPWGNADANNAGRVYVRPDVTINSGELPTVGPDVIIPNAANYDAPVVDGMLDDPVWQDPGVYSFDIVWDDAEVRGAYPGIGPYRSGQFQPELDGARAPVVDGGNATIKMFFRDDYLYFAADVNDALVQGAREFDRIDGVRLIIADRGEVNEEDIPISRRLLVSFDSLGTAAASEYLTVLADSSDSEWGVALKPNTTVDDNSDIDEGFNVEMKLDLSYLGYPAGLGDKLLFFGVMLADGDSFEDPANDYGNRTWFFREHDGGPAYAWAVMDVNTVLAIEDQENAILPKTIELRGNYPNPFNPGTTIRYVIPIAGEVELLVYNVLGEEVARVGGAKQAAGTHELNFDAQNLSSGIYFYQVQVTHTATGKKLTSEVAKMALIK